ncbi:MAG: DNA-binding response regulator [Hyphomicrobiales bacterium]|nr:response regulator transcription factor [Hyphomicrobiales bacterium]PCH50279.1 MAG: DNA-binding response regulator [Hyphomicrobiales bacterium]
MLNRIIIADDHPLFREGVRRIIQRVIVGKFVEVADTKSLFIEAEKDPAPIIMILDLVFPGFEGTTTIRKLREDYPQTALIVISMTDEESVANDIMSAGANGFISKSVPPDEMVRAIEKITQGETVICLDADTSGLHMYQNDFARLPPRHVDILLLLGQGKTNKEIARDLDISPNTVRTHISGLFKKLGVSTRSAAVAIAAQQGLI